MSRISTRLKTLGDSATLAIATKAKAMASRGRDVISLALGEPDFPTPSHIIEAAQAAMRRGETRYTPTAGTPALREAIAKEMSTRLGFPLGPDQIVVSTGAKQALYNTFQAILEPGDEVIVPLPCWVSYPAQVALAGGRLVGVPTKAEEGFCLDLDALPRQVGKRTRAILINSPCNPTGTCLSRSGVEEIARIALEVDLTIVSDEVYRDLVYEGDPPVSPASLGPEVAARCMIIDGVSKSFSMTGWRIGWLATVDSEVRASTIRLQSHSTSNACSVAQAAALAAITGPRGFQAGWLAEFDRRRKALLKGLNDLPGVVCQAPRAAFYAFPSVQDLLGPGGRAADDDALAMAILEQVGVATVPGSAFGAPGHLRLSYALSLERLMEAVERIKAFLSASATIGAPGTRTRSRPAGQTSRSQE